MTKKEQLKKAFRQIIIDVINGVEEKRYQKFIKEHGMGIKKYLDEKENELLTEVKIRTKI